MRATWRDITSIKNVMHGFYRTQAGTFTNFDAPGASQVTGSGTYATALGPNGLIVGFFRIGTSPSTFVCHAFIRYSNGVIHTFDAPGAGKGPQQGTAFLGVNSAGTEIGFFYDPANAIHGFALTAQGQFSVVDPPGALSTTVRAISRSGVIVGDYTDSAQKQHGFIRQASGATTTLDAPDALSTSVSGINASGEIVGSYETQDHVLNAFSMAPNGPTTLFSGPSRVITWLAGVNTVGVIAGYYYDSSFLPHGLLWLPTD
jgi:hypothetical protein